MYDKYQERQLVNIGHNNFHSKRFEVWSDGQMIDSGVAETVVTFETVTEKSPHENSILVAVDSNLSTRHLAKNFSFDTAYTNGDRILLATIAKKTNYDNYNSYAVFVTSAPFITRQEKIFAPNEPFAGSIFMIQGQPNKVTFSTAGTKSLIEFYSE